MEWWKHKSFNHLGGATPRKCDPYANGSIQVSGDGPTLPSLRPKVWVGAGLGLGLGLREGRVGPSPETWIDPRKLGLGQTVSASSRDVARFVHLLIGWLTELNVVLIICLFLQFGWPLDWVWCAEYWWHFYWLAKNPWLVRSRVCTCPSNPFIRFNPFTPKFKK